jgi:AraC family transcriptional regulator
MAQAGLEQVTADSFRDLEQFGRRGDASGISYYVSEGRPYTLDFSSEEDFICLVLGDIVNRTKFDDDKELDLTLIGGSINYHPRGGQFRVRASEVRHGFIAFKFSGDFQSVINEGNPNNARRTGNRINLQSLTIKPLVHYARERLHRPEPLLPFELQCLATASYLETLRKLSAAPLAARDSLSEASFRIIEEYIDENLEWKVSCADLAREVDLPLRAIFDGVKARTGHSLYGLVLEKRIIRARAMLAKSEAPIGEIAVACGFCSQQHLTSTFSRKLGVTPQQFRLAAASGGSAASASNAPSRNRSRALAS